MLLHESMPQTPEVVGRKSELFKEGVSLQLGCDDNEAKTMPYSLFSLCVRVVCRSRSKFNEDTKPVDPIID